MRTQVLNLMIKPLLIILVFLQLPLFAARTSMVVFPLVNKADDPLYEWISSVVPEYFSRKLGAIEGIRVWDPLFMYQTDSSGWRMQSDSLLSIHCNRWEWDAAVGGSYTVEGDSVTINLRIVWVSGTRQHVGMDISRKSSLYDCPSLCSALLLQTCTLLHLNLDAEDSTRIEQISTVAPHAYLTYCAGYGFEIHRQYAQALTAYNRAIQLDPSFVLAQCRLGVLYSRTAKAGDALSILKQLMRSRSLTPLTAAMTAEFAIDALSPEKAYRFVDRMRDVLEQSSAGLTVIGRQYLVAGEYQRAIASFRRAIAWGASNLDAEFLLGMAYLMSGEYTVAITLLNRLISMRPEYVRYHVLLGTVYRKADRLMESLSVLEVARKKEPENTMIMIETAHTCFALGWYRKAGQLLEQALQLKPDQNALLADLGIVYWHEKRFDDAQRYIAMAGKRKSGAVASLVNSGNIALHAGDIPEAITAYRKADHLGGNDPAIRYNLAMAYLADGKVKKAAYYLDALLSQTPGRTDLLISRATIAQKLGSTEDAEMAFRRILENDPYNDVAVEGLVRLLIGQKRYEEAIYRIESYLESKPARADFMLLLGETYRAQGWYEVAIERYRQIIQQFPDYGAGYIGVGRCMADMVLSGKSTGADEAIYALKQASGKLPDDPEPYLLMGDLYMTSKGYRDLAVEQWRKALALTSDTRKKREIERKIADAE